MQRWTFWCRRRHSWLVGVILVATLMLFPTSIHALEQEPTARGDTPSHYIYLPIVNRIQLPNSFALIDQAQERGDIDGETALTYRVFATFGDPRLPAAFQGDDSSVIDSDAVAEATQRFADLSPATQEVLVPYLIPPIYAGSWYDLKMRGPTLAGNDPVGPLSLIQDRCNEVAQGLLVPLESDHFVVWYPPFDAQMAERALRNSQNLENRIYPILTGLFRRPVSDAGLGCNPSDGRYDVYMVYDPIPGKERVLALVSTYPGTGCRAAPSYMLVLKAGTSEIDTLAHEFMHTIQFSHSPATECFPQWWLEATAEWAIDYFETVDVAPDDQDEQRSSKGYLESTKHNLWKTDKSREYGAYLWPFYMSHYMGSYRPKLIADIFAAAENAANGNLYQIINDRIQGGWEERWPEFAAMNLNLAPVDSYARWDNIPYGWGSWGGFGITTTATARGDPYFVWSLTNSFYPYEIGDLGIYYRGIAVKEDARFLAVSNPFVGIPFMRLQALIKRPGQGWQGPQEWTDRPWILFCQDRPAERVEQMIVMYSNSNWQRLTGVTPEPSDMRVIVSDLPCNGWQGSTTWQIAGHSSSADATLTYTITGQADPTFTLRRRTLIGDVLQFEYQSTAGSATWTTSYLLQNLQTGQISHCSRSGGQALTANLGSLVITEDLSADPMNRHFYGAGLVPAGDPCPGLESWTNVPWLQTDVKDSDLRPWPADATVGRLQGSHSLTTGSEDAGSTTASTWDLHVQPP